MRRTALVVITVVIALVSTTADSQSGPPMDPATIPANAANATVQYAANQPTAYAGDCQMVDSSSAGAGCSLTWQQADGSYLVNFFLVQSDGAYPAPPFDNTMVPALQPAGLIAVKEFQPGQANAFTSGVFNNAAITGVALRMDWKDVEPSPDQFNWQLIDGMFSRAVASQKFVVLNLVPGFGTPDWALQGVTTAIFARQYGLRAGEPGTVPMPWDQTYLSRWFAFLQAVADRYGSNPQFRMISADGPSSVSEETSLPNGNADVAHWMALGYRPDKYVTAWTTVFQTYARMFPGQYTSLALAAGLPIGNDGSRDPGETTATTQRILAAGMQFRNRLVVQENGLTGATNEVHMFDLVNSNSGNVVTGFELSTSATVTPGRQGDATNPVHALELSFQLGLTAHAQFFEVYEADVLNPAMQGVLQSTQAQLSP